MIEEDKSRLCKTCDAAPLPQVKMSINEDLVVVFEAKKNRDRPVKPKTQKGNYIFITQHILIQFIKRAEYASRSPFLSKKRYKVTIKLEMYGISWNCGLHRIGREGRNGQVKKGTRTIAKVTKVGDIQSEDQGCFPFYIYWTNYKNWLLRACVSHICSIVLCSTWKTIRLFWGGSHSLLFIFSFFTEDNGENRISPVALYYDGLPSS